MSQKPVVHYYNNDVQNDGISDNNYNFGPDRRPSALAAVTNRAFNTVEEAILYDLFYSMTPQYVTEDNPRPRGSDPALTAALYLHAAETLRGFPQNYPEVNLPIGLRADRIHERFLDNPKDWEAAVETLRQFLTGSGVSYRMEAISGNYRSQMYMKYQGLNPNAPSIIVRQTDGISGYAFVITTQNGVFKVRVTCGYQPYDIPYWRPPSTGTPQPTPQPTQPPTTPTPTQPPTQPPTTPTPAPTQRPPSIEVDITDPTPTPTQPPTQRPPNIEIDISDLEPKQPDAGPQAQFPNHPDFGGGPNTDIDRTPTVEPTMPPVYIPPQTEQREENGWIDTGGSQETILVDTDGDGQGDQWFTGEVITGDRPETPLEVIQADPPAVEEGLNNTDQSNASTGNIAPPD
jgi:hypothetical protein